MYDEPIVVKTQSAAKIPLAEVDLVFRVCGLLQVPALVAKVEDLLRSRIELHGISDLVVQHLVNRIEHPVESDLPVMLSGMAGEVGANITFAVASDLRDDDWR